MDTSMVTACLTEVIYDSLSPHYDKHHLRNDFPIRLWSSAELSEIFMIVKLKAANSQTITLASGEEKKKLPCTKSLMSTKKKLQRLPACYRIFCEDSPLQYTRSRLSKVVDPRDTCSSTYTFECEHWTDVNNIRYKNYERLSFGRGTILTNKRKNKHGKVRTYNFTKQ